MNRNFRPGQKVQEKDGTMQGIVRRVEGDTVFVEAEGMEWPFHSGELIPVADMDIDNAPSIPKDLPVKQRKKPAGNSPVIDLHIEKLIRCNGKHDCEKILRRMTPHEIFTEQLRHLENFIREAERKKIRSFTVVHGLGKGKLREEVRKILRRNGYDIISLPGDTAFLKAEKRR